MKRQLDVPASNADHVARRLVQAGMVAEIKFPGEGLAVLLEMMANLSRNIAAELRAAEVDWEAALAECDSVNEQFLHEIAARQELVLGDAWAQRWMVMHLAKHLALSLEKRCMKSEVAASFQSLVYEADGSIAKWSAGRQQLVDR